MAVFLRAQALKVPVVLKSARLHAIHELRGGGRGAKSVCVIQQQGPHENGSRCAQSRTSAAESRTAILETSFETSADQQGSEEFEVVKDGAHKTEIVPSPHASQ